MECNGCMWMLICVIAPLALLTACGILGLRAWALQVWLRLLPRADAPAVQELGMGIPGGHALRTVVDAGEASV